MQDRNETVKLKELRRELEMEIEGRLPQEAGGEIKVQIEKLDEALALDEATAKGVMEALLFSAGRPLSVSDLRRVLKGYTAERIEALLAALKADYERENRSFRLKEIANGYEISTEPKFAPWIMKLELQKRARQASQSALETLAILAYKQPVTRAEIEDLRGVNSSGVLAALLEKGFIRIAGRKEVPGRPLLYGTTDKFLEYFGLKSLAELPNLTEIKELVTNMIREEELIQPRGTVVENAPDAHEPEAPETPEGVPQSACGETIS
jgi:segregation and condensation protein B